MAPVRHAYEMVLWGMHVYERQAHKTAYGRRPPMGNARL
jgi:hypothetical protein